MHLISAGTVGFLSHLLPLLLLPAEALAASASSSASSARASHAANPTVTIGDGVLVGTTTSLPYATATVNKFLGIPFAVSPPERFSPPRAARKFGKTLEVQSYRPACIQQFPYPLAAQEVAEAVFNSPPPPAGESEDCLYLNVWTPSGTPPSSGGYAVMFWIFGGAFEFGTGTLAAYDGSAFASYQDVIIVTHNYRTNVFGFPGTTAIPLAQRNPGLLDQRLALQWVQNNIAAFGGDPKKVTIFGESAGAFSVDALLTSYTTDTAPFRAAILQSGQVSYDGGGALLGSSVTGPPFKALVQALNCTKGQSDLECARAAPALTIKRVIETQDILFPPTVDNVTMVAHPAARRQAGRFAKVPVLAGTNNNEGRVFDLGQANLGLFLNTTFNTTVPSLIPKLLAIYGKDGGYAALSNITTLLNFQCGAALMMNETAFDQDVPTWRYYYNATFPNLSPYNGALGVYHSSEISLVFGTYPGGPVSAVTRNASGALPTNLLPTAQQAALSKFMNGAWADFAKNPYRGPGWNRLGSYDGQDLGVIGGTGSCAGVEIGSSSGVDRPCQVLLPAFRYSTGDVYGLGHVKV